MTSELSESVDAGFTRKQGESLPFSYLYLSLSFSPARSRLLPSPNA